MDLQKILSQIITSINDIFQAEAASAALVAPSGQEMVIQAAVGAGAEIVRGLSLPLSEGVIGWVATHQKPALVPDVSKDDRFYDGIDKKTGFQTQSIMCVPMKVNGHTIGVIELLNMNPDYLSEDGLKIFRVIAEHAALTVQNLQLLEDTQKRSEEQAFLFEAMAIVTSDLALETVLDAVSRQMVEALQADLCLISRWHQEEQQLQLMQSYAGPNLKRPQQSNRSIDQSSIFLSPLQSQTVTLLESDSVETPTEGQTWLEKLGVKELLLIPLIYRRQTIGLVEIGRCCTADSLTQHELQLAEMMTVQAAVAIEHARLYDEATRRLAEAKVLQEVMVAAASTLNFDEVLSETIGALHRTLGIERLGFFLPNEDGTCIVPHPATIGYSLRNGEFEKIPIEGSAGGWVIRQGKPLLLPNVHESDLYYELAPDTQSEMAVPVMLDRQVVAVLNAESSRLHAFDEDDLRLFIAIAAELAIALKNARLFEEIQAAEANYRDLFDNANDFIFSLDSNFLVQSANKTVLQSTGYSLEEIKGTPITQFIKADHGPRLFKLLKAQLASEAPGTFELPIQGKNDQELLLDITFRIKREGCKPIGIHCIARNVSQRHELEKQLRQTEKLSAIGKLVSGVAHELNNPLTTIIGYANLLRQSDIPDIYRRDLDIIFQQTQRAGVIVKDLLKFARKYNLETAPVEINEIINASLTLAKPHLQAHGIQVVTALDFGLPRTMADPQQLEQVFVNLILNAVQAMATTGEPRQLTIVSKQIDSTIHLSFSDSGPGIPEEIINRIFDPFFSTKKVGEGTGLGLSMCFGIIGEHKGKIWVENNPQGGAIVHIELPITEPETQQRSYPQIPDSIANLPKRLRVLVVDDESPLLKLLSRVLGHAGYHVETATDGEIALQKIHKQSFDIIICDILMPDILGPELYEEAIEQYPHLEKQFIFITGNIVDRETRQFLEGSGLPWLSKPFLPSDVEELVRETAAKNKLVT